MSVWDVNESGIGLDVFPIIETSHNTKLRTEMWKSQQHGLKTHMTLTEKDS